MATINMTEFDPTINQHDLAMEWLRQAVMYHAAAVKVADARRATDEAKQALDVTRAETALAVRKDPASYGLEKTTEAVIEAAVLTQPAIAKATKELNDARYNADILGAAVASLDHKKRALEHLCDLQGRNYWAEPQARTEDAKAAIKADQDKGRKGGTPVPAEWNYEAGGDVAIPQQVDPGPPKPASKKTTKPKPAAKPTQAPAIKHDEEDWT